MIQIYVGSLENPSYLFEDDLIYECKSTQNVALVGQELSIDTFTPVVGDMPENTQDAYLFMSSDGAVIECADGALFALEVKDAQNPNSLINIPDGTPVWYYRYSELVGKWYVDTVKRVGKNKYQMNCVSAMGRLDKMYHGGGLFKVSTFGRVLRHILSAGLHGNDLPVIPFAIDPDVEDLPVSGWLPYGTKRNNLYQLIFANGVNIIKNDDGNPRFTFLYTAGGEAANIEKANVFVGGEVEYVRPYSSVSIMEHTYSEILDTNPVTLYDNTTSSRVSEEEIWFDQAPVIVSTLTASDGLTIVSATENSAILTGNGKLTGIPYTHTTRTVSRVNSTWDKEKTASVERCTMVNELNSVNLLNRLFAFYCPPDYIKKIKNEIIYTDQRVGKQYSFLNPYNELESAMLSRMDINATTFNRASCDFYAGYNPVGQMGLFKHCIILDRKTLEEDGGVFQVPEEVFEATNPQIRVVMIAGGTGGTGGWPGENGKDAYTHVGVHQGSDVSAMWYGAEGGNGGVGGEGGNGGRVYAVTIENPATSYRYTIGRGGVGGEPSGFIPDTVSELRAALKQEDPDRSYTDNELQAMVNQEKALTTWTGAPKAGATGSSTTFGQYTTDADDAYIPVGGVYNPLTGEYYATKGKSGIAGGKGGARKVGAGGDYAWTTDGESVYQRVQGEDLGNGLFTETIDREYKGGTTGEPMTSVNGLPEAKLTAYGGSGAGAAVGIDRDDHPHMNGDSSQDAFWEVVQIGE